MKLPIVIGVAASLLIAGVADARSRHPRAPDGWTTAAASRTPGLATLDGGRRGGGRRGGGAASLDGSTLRTDGGKGGFGGGLGGSSLTMGGGKHGGGGGDLSGLGNVGGHHGGGGGHHGGHNKHGL